MQRFFHSKRFKILLGILAALMIGIIIAAASHGGASPSSSLLGAVFSPLQRLSAYVSEQIGNFSGGFVSAGTYAKEIDELKQQIADYQKKLVDYDEMKRQITSYESVLGVKEAIRIGRWRPLRSLRAIQRIYFIPLRSIRAPPMGSSPTTLLFPASIWLAAWSAYGAPGAR